ncbi:MAG TPA: hypothetical protein PL045_05960 [Chitinophagaceae bacterium]|nr:hypothetical protein [Chitinophagaceae bacterium]
MAVTERPYNYCLSKNDIRYVFALTDLERAGLYLQVKLLYAAIGDTEFEELTTFELKPDSDGKVYIYLQAYLNSVLNYVLPAFNNPVNITGANDQCRQFYVQFREVTDDDADPEWDDIESAHIRIAIKSGVEKHKFARNNFFNYRDANHLFLSWQPSHGFIFWDEPVCLSFLNNTYSTEDFLIVRIKCFSKNNVEQVLDYSVVMDKQLYHLYVQPDALALSFADGDDAYYFEFFVLSSDGENVYCYKRFYIEYRPNYNCYDLLYHNSLGGLNMLRIVAEPEIAINRDAIESDAGMSVADANAMSRAFEKTFSSITQDRTYKGEIGYLKTRTKQEQEAHTDILMSNSIYQKIDDKWIPVIAMNKTALLGKPKDNIATFGLEWRLSESNEVFTPAGITFGPATDTENYGETCVGVGAIISLLPDAVQNKAYSYSINLTGTAPFALSDVVKPAWMTIAITGSVLSFTGTPGSGDVGTNIEVSLTVTNCSSNSALFTDTLNVTNTIQFTDRTVISTDSLTLVEHANITGVPGSTVTVKLDTLTNTNGGTLKVNTVTAAVNDEWDVVLDSGGSGYLTVGIYGVSHPGSIILGHFTIINVTDGVIGTPDVYQISKTF